MSDDSLLVDYEQEMFHHGGISHAVYRRTAGPAVVLLHELWGLERVTLELGNRLHQRGFTPVVPLLFGQAEVRASALDQFRMCIGRELHVFMNAGTSPIVDWLRELCAWASDRHEERGVGVIGMCLTGNFAITLLAEPSVLVSAACQPSLPFLSGKSLGLTKKQLAATKRALSDEGKALLAYRFEGDRFCPASKFARLKSEFEQNTRVKELPGSDHSVLTYHFRDEEGHPTRSALEEIVGFLEERLLY